MPPYAVSSSLCPHDTVQPPASHGDEALGGYALPSLSTLGSQVQRSSFGMLSMTMGMCEPQPHQVDLLQVSQEAFLHMISSCG